MYIELQRQMDRIIGQQRRMAHFLMLLQDEEGRDERLRRIEDEMKRLEEMLNGLGDKLDGLK